jgi:nitrite reductase/ring-hydroxylating ferredoxin subunit
MAADSRLICRADALVDGGPGVRFSVAQNGSEAPAFAIRHCGRVFAYLNRCAHVPIELDWQGNRLHIFHKVRHSLLLKA